MQNIIYALQDPRTFEIRYVGKSSKGMKRPKFHLLPCAYSSPKNTKIPVYIWIRKLARLGLSPKILVIQTFSDISFLPSAELYWMNFFESQGSPLLNVLKGSSIGSLDYRFSKEQKQKMSLSRKGKKSSDNFKRLMREHWKKNPNQNSSLEFKEKVSVATKSWWNSLDPLIKNKIITKNLTFRGKNAIKIIDSENVIYNSYTEAAAKNNCTDGAIRYCINNKTALRKQKTFQVYHVSSA